MTPALFLKKTGKVLLASLLALIILISLYFLAAWGLSRLSTSREAATTNEVSIYILTNGVHTDLVLPVRHAYIDWSQLLPFENTRGKDTLPAYVAFGWGDKGFYLETPTWADLKASTALKAAFNMSTSAIHVTYYRRMWEDESCRKIEISHTQYERLVKYVRNSFRGTVEERPQFIPTNAQYGDNDAFYEGRGSYHLFHTCNTWANNGLKSCGQRACWWTIFDTGIFLQYKK